MSKLSAVPRRRKARALVRIIPIREFWKVYCGFSPATGYRREHDDPDHPPLVLIGANRRGVREDDAIRCQAVLSARALDQSNRTLDPGRARVLAKMSHAKRALNRLTRKAAAEALGAVSTGISGTASRDTPGDSPTVKPCARSRQAVRGSSRSLKNATTGWRSRSKRTSRKLTPRSLRPIAAERNRCRCRCRSSATAVAPFWLTH